jgi:hypothetical protein
MHGFAWMVPLTTFFVVAVSSAVALKRGLPLRKLASLPQESTVTKSSPKFAERLKARLPNDFSWWEVWMNGSSLPAFLTALRAGYFDALEDGPKSFDQITKITSLPVRSSRILLGHMVALGLLQHREGRFSLTQVYRRQSKRKDLKRWIKLQWKEPITCDTYFNAIVGNGGPRPWDRLTLGQSTFQKIADDSLSFASVMVADRLGIVSLLPSTESEIATWVSINHPKLSAEGLRDLLQRLESFKIVTKYEGVFRVSHWARPSLDPQSAFYKGGTLRLMWGAPPSPAQSWAALEKERKRSSTVAKNSGETLMDQSTLQAELQATTFATHMDAQGAGQDVIVAKSAFKPGDRVVDVAGGGGSYSILGASLHENTRFLVSEKGAMVRVASKWIQENASLLKGKVEAREGDMFEPATWQRIKSEFRPNKIFVSNIFHDWTLETNLKLAELAYATLPDKGQLIVHEMPVGESTTGPFIATAFSEVLRVWTEGTQYKRSEIKSVLTQAGFKNIVSTKGHGPFVIFTATKKLKA